MKESKTGYLLRILIGEDDQYKGKPLYEQIVLKARELKLSGATVFKGIMSFGADSLIHTAKILSKYPGSDTEKALLKLLKSSTDPYIQAAAIESLAIIGTSRSSKTLEDLSVYCSVIAREKAMKAIKSIKKRNE